MQSILQEYVLENPDANYASLAKRFGDPHRIAESCVIEMDTTDILNKLQIRQKILAVAVGAIALALVVRLGVLTMAYLGYADDMNGYATIEVIEIERTEVDERGN